MAIQIANNPANIPIKASPSPSRAENSVSHGALIVNDNPKDISNKLKAGVLLSTSTGVGLAMLRTFKVHEMPYKLSSLWKITYDQHGAKSLPNLIKRLAIGSVGGGLAAGLVLDKKENRKAKIRESIMQMVGNISIPIGMVMGAEALHSRFENKINGFFKFKKDTILEKAPKTAMTIGALVAGIFIGNSVGNFINKTLFKCDEKRTLKLTDMSPHLDDMATAATFIAPKDSCVGNYMARVVPLALTIAGYSTGVAQEKKQCPKLESKDNTTVAS